MDRVYRIAKWDTVFERSESRKLKQLTWVAMPVGFTSHGYQSLLDEFEDEAAAIYGTWCAVVGVAAGCVHRGIFCSSRGIPLTIPRISRMTGLDQALIAKLFAWALRDDIRWLEIVEPAELQEIVGAELPEIPQKRGENDISGESPGDLPELQEKSPTTRQYKTEQDKTEQDKDVGASTDAVADDGELREFLIWWNSLRRNEPPLVPCGASEDEPSQAVRKAWRAVLRNSELRRLISDRDAIEKELRTSSFCRDGGWFRPERLLSGKNRDGEWIVKKLLDGGFRDTRQPAPVGPGQQFDPNYDYKGF